MRFANCGEAVVQPHVAAGSCKHVVDDGHELHDPLIKVEVFQALEEVGVLAAI